MVIEVNLSSSLFHAMHTQVGIKLKSGKLYYDYYAKVCGIRRNFKMCCFYDFGVNMDMSLLKKIITKVEGVGAKVRLAIQKISMCS